MLRHWGPDDLWGAPGPAFAIAFPQGRPELLEAVQAAPVMAQGGQGLLIQAIALPVEHLSSAFHEGSARLALAISPFQSRSAGSVERRVKPNRLATRLLGAGVAPAREQNRGSSRKAA